MLIFYMLYINIGVYERGEVARGDGLCADASSSFDFHLFVDTPVAIPLGRNDEWERTGMTN